jgi:chromate transporter
MSLSAAENSPSLQEAVRVWMRVGLLSFGGPAGQIAVMHRILVEEKRWISEERFLHALNYCMLLPGPEAQQLATYIGWLLHGTRGGLIAGLLFIFPGVVAILLLSILYAGYQELPLVEAVFFGVKAAVLAIVLTAVRRIAARAVNNAARLLLAAGAFIALFFFAIPFPLVIVAALLIGFFGSRRFPQLFATVNGHAGDGDGGAVPSAAVAPSLRRSVAVAGLWLTIWLLPLAAMLMLLGREHVFVQAGTFFSVLAVVTFGGAYAVLAYVAQAAVENFGWLAPGEMLDGLGMAETTPGPLIMVVQFVGFLAAYRNPGALDPLVAGLLGSLVVTWVTFAPCFLWIFLGAPYIERLRGAKTLSAALSAITAAVVGVILNLALWFALHVLFARVEQVWLGPLRLWQPVWATLDPAALVLTAAALLVMLRGWLGMIPTLLLCAAAGVALRMF